tara:strand:+ start:168 stop:1409 length:1242 start_codon:yes stop_codon:yes gene_type:complete
MDFRIGKNGKKLKLYCWIDSIKHTVDSFDLNEKLKAKKSKEYHQNLSKEDLYKKLKIQDKEKRASDKVEFKYAFKKYYASVENDKSILASTGAGYISLLKIHVEPYIHKTYLADFKYIDFKGAVDENDKSICLYNKIIESLPAQWVKINDQWEIVRNKNYDDNNKLITIDKNTIKKAIAEFKKFVVFCGNNDWVIDNRVLAYRNKNLKPAEKEEWVPDTNDVFKLIKLEENLCLKTLYYGAAETGCSLSEILGWCYEDKFFDDELDSEIIFVRNSLGSQSQFRPGTLKNGGRKRKVEISDKLSTLLDQWMIHQILPKTHLKKYRRIFPFTKGNAADILKRSIKKIGIEWQGAFSGFRKFSSSAADDTELLTEEQFIKRYGWKSKKTFVGHYRRDLNRNKQDRKKLINNLISIN